MEKQGALDWPMGKEEVALKKQKKLQAKEAKRIAKGVN